MAKIRNYSVDFNFENRIKEIVKEYMESWKSKIREEGEKTVNAFTNEMIDLKTTIVESSLWDPLSKSLKFFFKNK